MDSADVRVIESEEFTEKKSEFFYRKNDMGVM